MIMKREAGDCRLSGPVGLSVRIKAGECGEMERGENPSTSGLISGAGGSPSSCRNRSKGVAQCREARVSNWPNGPRRRAQEKRRAFVTSGNPGKSGGEKAEKKPPGVGMVDTQLISLFSATSRVANVSGCATSKSASTAAAHVSSYDSRRAGRNHSRMTLRSPAQPHVPSHQVGVAHGVRIGTKRPEAKAQRQNLVAVALARRDDRLVAPLFSPKAMAR